MEQKRVKDTRNQNDEIDLLEILKAFKRWLWLILLAAVLGGGAAGSFSKFVLIPEYTSTAMLYVLSKETTLTSLADLQIGSQLTKDYRIIVTSRPVLQDVIQSLGLDMSYRDLRKKLTIDNPSDSRILTITAQDPDPNLAKLIVDQVSATASDYIGEIMEMVPPKLIEDGEASNVPVGPNHTRNAMMGAMAAVTLVCGIITLQVILNDTVRTEDDVARYLGITVLASVPEREGSRKKNSRRQEKRKKTG